MRTSFTAREPRSSSPGHSGALPINWPEWDDTPQRTYGLGGRHLAAHGSPANLMIIVGVLMLAGPVTSNGWKRRSPTEFLLTPLPQTRRDSHRQLLLVRRSAFRHRAPHQADAPPRRRRQSRVATLRRRPCGATARPRVIRSGNSTLSRTTKAALQSWCGFITPSATASRGQSRCCR